MTKLYESKSNKCSEEVKKAYQECIDLCDEIAKASWFYDQKTASAIADLIKHQCSIWHQSEWTEGEPIRHFEDYRSVD